MTDSRHEQDWAELAALYALEALGDDAQRQFARSLETASASTREEVAAFQDVVQELAYSGPAIAPPASLKERLMARIAQEPQEQAEGTGFTFVRSKGLAWHELGAGLSMKVLFHDPVGSRTTMLLRLAPGGTLIGHRHPQVEELYVLEGSCLCAGEFLQVGDYHRAEAGTVHPVTSSEEGCLALVMTSSKNEPIR
ncbi:MAG: Cupin7 domain-containing protein [Nitrospira sp.]|nr:cupin domain-containing protein [Nitrospira sp.]ULA60556.1 MAG: Cupin7 domain-containing protein [Nitrospira sp.]